MRGSWRLQLQLLVRNRVLFFDRRQPAGAFNHVSQPSTQPFFLSSLPPLAHAAAFGSLGPKDLFTLDISLPDLTPSI